MHGREGRAQLKRSGWDGMRRDGMRRGREIERDMISVYEIINEYIF